MLTLAVIVKEVLRLMKTADPGGSADLLQALGPGLLGMVLSFGAALLALRLLSGWLERARWYLFSLYCLCAAGVVLYVG